MFPLRFELAVTDEDCHLLMDSENAFVGSHYKIGQIA